MHKYGEKSSIVHLYLSIYHLSSIYIAIHLLIYLYTNICLTLYLCVNLHRNTQSLWPKSHYKTWSNETLGWTTFFPFLKQPHVEMFMIKSRGEYHTYRHPLRGFSLMWYHPLKASYQQSQSNELKTLSSHYPLVSPRLLWARVRDGLHGPEFLISVLSIIKQGPSFPSCFLMSGEKSTDPRTLSWPQ